MPKSNEEVAPLPIGWPVFRANPEFSYDALKYAISAYIHDETISYCTLQPSRRELNALLISLRRRADELFARAFPEHDVKPQIRFAIKAEGEKIARTLIARAKLSREMALLNAKLVRLQEEEQTFVERRHFAHKILWHRLDCGFLKDDLANHIALLNDTPREVEKRNLVEYEAGRRLPTPGRLGLLARIFTEYGSNGPVSVHELLPRNKPFNGLERGNNFG